MIRMLLGTTFCLLLFSCHKITNNINNIEYECGTQGSLESFHYVKLLDESGQTPAADGLVVRNENLAGFQSLLTAKSCLQLPHTFHDKIIVSYPNQNGGLILYPERLAFGAIQPVVMKTHHYKSLTSPCQTDIATRSSSLAWPFDWNGADSSGYALRMELSQGDKIVTELDRIGVDDVSSEKFDISQLNDGIYRLSLVAAQIFSKDPQEVHFSCNLIIDRSAPLVVLDREVIRLESDGPSYLRAAPGEAIRIQTLTSGSNDSLYACMMPLEVPAASCKFDLLSTGYVTAPQRGTWMLRLYSQDQAGNTGPLVERKLQIYDGNLVGAVRAYLDQSALAQQSGAFLSSLILSIKAYEKMQTLGSEAEIQSVFQSVKKNILESVSMPVEEFIMNRFQKVLVSGLAITHDSGQPQLVLNNANNALEIFDMNGALRSKVDFAQILGVNESRVNFRYCDPQESVVVTADTRVVIFKNGTQLADYPLVDGTGVSFASQAQDCAFAILEASRADGTRKRIVMDLQNGKQFPMAAGAWQAVGLLNASERQKIIYLTPAGLYFQLDLATGAIQNLADLLEIGNIREIKKAKDGTTGILSSDQKFHIVSVEGKIVSTTERVSFMQASVVPNEYSIITDNVNLQLIASDGTRKSTVSVESAAWNYLAANDEFIVGLASGSNVVKVWTRQGNTYDEIYTKGDSIMQAMLSMDGYLYLESRKFFKVYQLKNSLSRKNVPPLNYAVGLQWADSGNLLYKIHRPVFDGVMSGVANQLVRWDLSSDQKTMMDLPVPGFSETKTFPGYGSQSRDLAYFTQNGQNLVATLVNRGSVAVYNADTLQPTGESYFLSSNWLLDVAVDPSGDVIAAAGQNGDVFVVGRKNGGWGATSLNDVYSQYFTEYPVTLNFDKTGKNLFVTDLNHNLMKYAVEFNADTQEYVLTLVNKVSDAGINLAIHGDMLALVGHNSKLNLYNADLQLIKQYDLNTATMGMAVAFSPDGDRVYAGVYDGSWSELTISTGDILRVKFSLNETGATNLVVSPSGDQLAFMGAGMVQVMDLNQDRVYKSLCTWLKPRLPYIPDLSTEDRNLCSGF